MRILLIEDEPSAMRHLKSIITLKCDSFEIVGTAEDGGDGLEKVRSLKPDVVITDIKMPIMDGIKLVAHIKQEFPHIYSIIVSGYQDFEYAKGALQYGVVDYLLKPVAADQLSSLLNSINEKLQRDYYIKRIDLLKAILSGKQIETNVLNKYLPFKLYSAAVIREKGIPSRFSSKYALEYNNPLLESCLENNIKSNNHIWTLPGRDDKEIIFIYSPEITSARLFEECINEVLKEVDNCYHTTIFLRESITISNIKKYIGDLYRTLDNKTIIGYSQIIYGLPNASVSLDKRVVLEEILINKISYLVSNGMYEELRKELSKFFASWEKEQRNQLWVESCLRHIIGIIEKHTNECCGCRNYDIEFMLDEALCYSNSLRELMDNVWHLVEKITLSTETKNVKADTLAYFNSIEKYITNNISEPISLPSICTLFGISQSYMSRLFRKYKEMSFNEYVTSLRIEKAKALILGNPDMNLKDVAAFVGYNDQFYFSRVFKSMTGVPPSEFS
jgi:YesN/AraC family two-component response regulator